MDLKEFNKQMTAAQASANGTRNCSNCHSERKEDGGKFVPFTSNPKRTRWICKDCVQRITAIKARSN